MQRDKKRKIIAAVYLIIFVILGFFIYLIIKPDPTCLDDKKNQGEENIDCGGPCVPCKKIIQAQPLVVSEKAFVQGSPGEYDVAAKIFNPNNLFGSSEFSYKFILRDSEGNKISEKSGRSFILPAETKYAIEIGIETEIIPQAVSVEISDVEWQEFSTFEKPKLNIYNKRYGLITGGVGYSEAYGLLKNESAFDFNFIKIKVALRDLNGKIVALNTTDMRTINANEQRDFRLLWPMSFPGDVSQVDMEAEADVYNSENFIKKYLPERDFQKLGD